MESEGGVSSQRCGPLPFPATTLQPATLGRDCDWPAKYCWEGRELARGRPGRVARREYAERRAGGRAAIPSLWGGVVPVAMYFQVATPSDSVVGRCRAVGGAVRSTLNSALRWPRTGVAKAGERRATGALSRARYLHITSSNRSSAFRTRSPVI